MAPSRRMSNARFLPTAELRRIVREGRRRWGLRIEAIRPDGRPHPVLPGLMPDIPMLRRARAEALAEAVRWGEPHPYLPATGIMDWIVPLVDGDQVLGGLSAGGVRVEAVHPADDPAPAHLIAAGCPRARARRWVASRPVLARAQVQPAADALMRLAYAKSGLRPGLLDRHREDARQQREIAEEIHARKIRRAPLYSFAEERVLFSMIKAGDRGGARRELNRLLAGLFLDEPRVAVLQARLVELLGYLVRAAVEDNPMLAGLVERHRQWLRDILAGRDFEELCHVIRHALNEFMDAVALQGFNRSSEPVRRALDYLGAHFTRRVRLKEVAGAAGLSPFRIAHLVKECTGRTVMEHVRRLRIESAMRHLEDTDRLLSDLAYDLGFTDQSSFIRQFKAHAGITPARYRRGRRMAGVPPRASS